MLYFNNIFTIPFNQRDCNINSFTNPDFHDLGINRCLDAFYRSQINTSNYNMIGQISSNILPLSLLLYTPSSNTVFNVFQIQAYPQFNINITNPSTIKSQFQNFIADINEYSNKNIFDTSFINTLMYGFVKYLEFQEKNNNQKTNGNYSTHTMLSLINMLITELDPMGLILGQDYRYLDSRTIKYIEKFLSRKVGMVFSQQNKFSLYLLELQKVLENILKKYGNNGISDSQNCQNTNTSTITIAQYINSSSYSYLFQFTSSVSQINSLISLNNSNLEKLLNSMSNIDVLALSYRTEGLSSSSVFFCPQIILEEIAPKL